MVFSSPVFMFLFLPLLLVGYYLPCVWTRKLSVAEDRSRRNGLLLVFSLAFYAWGEPHFIFIMLFYILLNWQLGLWMAGTQGRSRKIIMLSAVGADFLLLAVFKYLSFISRNITALTGNDKYLIDIALPIGISFFTFQMMSYIFDVYYRTTEPQKNPFKLALYISFFPQLIAGPIVRYHQIADEISGRRENLQDIVSGTKRFIYGLGKKVLLANFMAQIADNVFDYYADLEMSAALAWIGAIAYTLQIYFDFSGYSDMAIGLGRIFGFHFDENFRYPYMAASVTDFWRRWHISLSTWFRDYVYIPLGGSRVSPPRQVLNLFIVWLLTGIWHGANWTFLCWGLFYFLLLLFERRTGLARPANKSAGFVWRVFVLILVVMGWVMFRADSLTAAVSYYRQLFSMKGRVIDSTAMEILRGAGLIPAIALIGATPLPSRFMKTLCRKGMRAVENVWLAFVFCLSLLEVISATYNPFIYFNF